MSDMEVTDLGRGLWAVRPRGCLGTCGWKDGEAWTVIYVRARTASEALNKALVL